jgi:hypothetical protein
MLSDQGRAIAHVIAGTAEIGRAIITTPGVPPQRLAALRSAFQATLKDPDFLAAVAKRKLLRRDTTKLPKPTVAALRELLKK